MKASTLLGIIGVALISSVIGGLATAVVAKDSGWFQGPAGPPGPVGVAGRDGKDVASINSIAGTFVLSIAAGEKPFCPAGTKDIFGTLGGRVALPTKNTYDKDFSRLVEYRLCMIEGK